MTAIKSLLQSRKFWTTIIGGVATAAASLLASYGLELSDAAVQQIAGTIAIMFTVLVGAQGLADHGKEAAKTTGEATKSASTATTPPVEAPANSTGSAVQLSLLLIALVAVTTQPACGSLKDSGKRMSTSAID
jgi:uncharacterized membrane protein